MSAHPHEGDRPAPAGLLFEHPSSLEHDPREQLAGTPTRRSASRRSTRLSGAGDLGWQRRLAPAAQRAELGHYWAL